MTNRQNEYCRRATSNKTRIETESCLITRDQFESRRATSNKTRIETVIQQQKKKMFLIVAEQLPIKQGLKHPRLFVHPSPLTSQSNFQ